ncbi:MAG: family 43 glycosylhydrolase [Muribaculaceae bacterium]
MDKCIITAVAMAMAAAIPASARSLGPDTYTNPVFKTFDTADPSVMRDENGRFQCFCTGGWGRESDDMVNWRDAYGKMYPVPTWNGDCALWAPDGTRVGNKFVYYYSLAIWGQEWVSAIGRGVSDSGATPFTDLGCLFTSNSIGVKNSIDQCLFVDDDGRCYLFWGSFNGIYAIELTEDGLYLKPGAQKVKVAGNAFEGTMIHKHDGYYYLIASTGTCCEGLKSSYTTVVGRSNNVFGPYTDRAGGNMTDNYCHFLLSANRYFNGTGHNSEIITDDAGQDWIYYHAFEKSDIDAGRTLYMDRVEWIDGWPVINNGFPSYYAVPAPYVHDASADPRITVNESTLWFTVNKDESVCRDLVVTTANLTGDITASIEGDNSQYFSLDRNTLPAAGGTIRVTYTPDWNVGAHRPSLVLRSPGAEEVHVLLRGTANDAVTPGSGDNTTSAELGQLQSKWLYSVNQGNLSDAPWFAKDKPHTRSMTVIGDKLYVLSASAYDNNPSLAVVDANTGKSVGQMSLSGLPTSGQLFCAGALGHLGDQLIMSNAVMSAAHTLYIYKWNNNTGNPVPVLSYSNASLGIAYGEIMGTWGDMNNGKIAFGNESKVVIFNVKDGSVSNSPVVVTLPQALADATKDSPRGKFEVRFCDDGTFWHTSYWTAPTRYRIDGDKAVKVESIAESALTSTTGTAARIFDYGTNRYAALTSMHGGYSGGHMQIVRITDGVAQATSLGKYPEQGLGTADWTKTAACTQVEHQLSGKNNSIAKFWVMVPEQGIAHYVFDGSKSSAESEIADSEPAETAPVYFTLQGRRVPADSLVPGIYIVRRGASVTKEIIR